MINCNFFIFITIITTYKIVKNDSLVFRYCKNAMTELGEYRKKGHQINHRRKLKPKRNNKPKDGLDYDPLPVF